jgi:histidyl-tRNA synthetase
MQNAPQPVKLFNLSSFYRYERPQAGRYREFHQLSCEAIGEADPALDAEVIDMAWQLFRSLGIEKLHLKINDIGCKNCRPAYLDKLKGYYATCNREVCPDCKVRLEKNPLRLLDCKVTTCRQIADSAPKSYEILCPECAAHFEQLQKYLALLGLPFEIDHCLVRGLDYYTRTVLRSTEEEGGKARSAPGRYDGLIEELGARDPAIGFATGIERIIVNLKRQNIAVPPLPNPQVFIASLGEAARDSAIKLSASLRKDGISVIQAPGSKSLKAQLRQANSQGVRYAVIIGEDEIKTGTVQLRNMQTSEQKSVALDKLKEELTQGK